MGLSWYPPLEPEPPPLTSFSPGSRLQHCDLDALPRCLLTGFECPLTYFYCIYFFVLLVHRALRDDHACGSKSAPTATHNNKHRGRWSWWRSEGWVGCDAPWPRLRYGADWVKYKESVPWLFFPGLY